MCAFMVFKQHCSFYLGTCAHVCHICGALEASGVTENVSCLIWVPGTELRSSGRRARALPPSNLCSPTALLPSTLYKCVHAACTMCLWGQRTTSRSLFFLPPSFHHSGSGAQTRASRLGSKCLCSPSQIFILEQDAKNTEIGASKMVQWLDTW